MRIGTQIFSPEGWDQIPKNIPFHFLKSDAKRRRVLLVHFATNTGHNDCNAYLLVISRKIFEQGVMSENIRACDNKSSFLPPWLEPLNGIDLSQIDHCRPHAKVLHQTRVENRYLHIASTIRDFDNILSSDKPEAEINRRAALCTPPQNETRFRLWVLTYQCFGQNIWMLLPPFHNIGHWSRQKYPDKKYGSPSIAFGKNYGNGMSKELVALSIGDLK